MQTRKILSFTLFIIDIAVWYAALVMTLIIRYQTLRISELWQMHAGPFSIVFALWALLFYITGLYDWRNQIFKRRAQEKLIQTMLLAGGIALGLFYLVPAFGITPKTNLLIHLILSTTLLFVWRWLFSSFLSKTSSMPVLFVGWSKEAEELAELFKNNGHLGYKAKAVITQEPPSAPPPLKHYILDHQLPKIIEELRIGLVVAETNLKNNKEFVRMLYEILPTGINFVDIAGFYENIVGKIPLPLISEVWFLENIAQSQKRVFSFLKRAFDIIAALLLGILTLLLSPFIILAIKLDSSGSATFKQKRVGEKGKVFTIIKFRTMRQDAERDGARWAKEDDHRITRIGKFLRKSRLDELPQIWNILRGEMSFIGPRPERPEFVKNLEQKIPFYNMRHLVKPGLSGWAQINFPYGASVEDAVEKMQYDLYYIKNQSLILDASIALKTLAVMVSKKGR